MKKIIRTFLFTTAALYAAYLLIQAFSFYSGDLKTTGLLILAVSILYLFIRPLLAIISLPNRGVLFFFILFLTTGILFYILTIILPTFAFNPTTLPGIVAFGYNLPSKDLNSIMSLVFSALVTSLVYLFLESLCNTKK
jgi:uncharacterized membrane protein YvlD (DUF360 family)